MTEEGVYKRFRIIVTKKLKAEDINSIFENDVRT